jgi:tRNA pseudouridine55 synthase
MRRQVHGILLLDKPPGFTSNAALQKVKRLFGAKKAGHTGSLDPIATGMLPICFGEATKFSQFLLESDKSYEVQAKLGIQTTSGDTEGEVVSIRPFNHVTADGINLQMKKFMGEIEQTPPMFSAIKVNGKPLYELARKGIVVERKTRRIRIYDLTLDHFSEDIFSFTVRCSKGTYVRTLVEDTGEALGCGAHVIGLRRMYVAPYHNQKMIALSSVEEMAATSSMAELDDALLPIATSVESYPAVKLSTAAQFYLRMGQAVRVTLPPTSTMVRLFSEDDRFLGVGEVTGDGRVKPSRLLSQ